MRATATARLQFVGVLLVLLLADGLVIGLTEEWPRARFATYGPNLAVDLFSVFIAVFLVQRLLDWRHQQELDAMRRVAAIRLRRVLNPFIRLLRDMYKAASERPAVPPDSVASLIDAWSREVAHLDFAKRAPDFPHRMWCDHLSKVTAAFQSEARDILDLYAEAVGDSFTVRIEGVLATKCFDLLLLANQIPLILMSHAEELGAPIPFAPPTSVLLGPSFKEGDRNRQDFASKLKALVEAAEDLGADVSQGIDDWEALSVNWGEARA